MSDAFISEHESTKTRKKHRCRLCYQLISPGERCVIYKGVGEGHGFYTTYFHPECREYSLDWDQDEWETAVPGCVSRKEVLATVSKTETVREVAS